MELCNDIERRRVAEDRDASRDKNKYQTDDTVVRETKATTTTSPTSQPRRDMPL